ncbi:MAG: hypothetical protein ACPGF7_09380 [Pontibacterium sp.]
MSKRKGHNLHKRYEQQARALMRGLAVCYSTDTDSYCRLINIKTGCDVPVTPMIQRALTTVKYKWSVIICVFGPDYMKSEQIDCNEYLAQAELADYLNERHQTLIKGFNSNHLECVGWLASPVYRDWDEKQAYERLRA